MKGNALYFDAEGNPVEVVIPDISIYEAKIAAQNATLAERDAQISTYAADLSVAKAANYDLLINGSKADTQQEKIEEDNDAGTSGIDYEDLFQ